MMFYSSLLGGKNGAAGPANSSELLDMLREKELPEKERKRLESQKVRDYVEKMQALDGMNGIDGANAASGADRPADLPTGPAEKRGKIGLAGRNGRKPAETNGRNGFSGCTDVGSSPS
ncbi:hypothetical protein [Candidatus Liberibacter sp.]|uniref:hypothetical protein n=1 Tax=Candidatus Liberibacter sp. TaxID=34022 RepID=UPI0015F697B1|nr:hypothetical protein [Candidatus Liberibacter sp.]MBA5723892.1 hypothetical protein [Candidatus Liberibacter sp.]